MNNILSDLQQFANSNDFRSMLNLLCEKEKSNEIVLYAGTYSFETALERFGEYDSASFYFYTKKDAEGYHVYLNRMGCGIMEDDGIFKISHERLYNKKSLSNVFWGEKDLRSGQYFEQYKNLLHNGLREILLFIISSIIAFIIAVILPFELPFELLLLIGCIISLTLFGIGLLIVYITKKRKRK